MLSALVRTRSRMLPLIWVGVFTSWDKILVNTRSQNKLEKGELPVNGSYES